MAYITLNAIAVLICQWLHLWLKLLCAMLSPIVPREKQVARKGRPPRKSKRPGREIVFFNVRMPEALRRDIQASAEVHNRSMNDDIVRRLMNSFRVMDAPHLVADAIITGLGYKDAVLDEIVKRVLRDRMTDKEVHSSIQEEHDAQYREYLERIKGGEK